MFCSNCGKKVESDDAKFCIHCGASLYGAGPAAQAAPAPQRSILYTNEQATMAVAPRTDFIIGKAFQNAATLRQPRPTVVSDPMFKAKCEYCMTTFTYHYSNLGFRKWYPHGFVYCPTCRKPLRHSLDLLATEFVHEVDLNGRLLSSHPVQR